MPVIAVATCSAAPSAVGNTVLDTQRRGELGYVAPHILQIFRGENDI
jgi:hypothetical protein